MAQADERMRTFISYRHAESDDPDVNKAHRAWIGRLVEGLDTRGVRAIWDEDLRKSLSRHARINPFELPLCAEISRAFTAIADVFTPIITTRYLERLGIENGQPQNRIKAGVVFEEWQGGGHLVQAALLRAAPVLRRGKLNELNLNPVVSQLGMLDWCDMRGDDPGRFEQELDRLAAIVLSAPRRNHLAYIEPDVLCDAYIAWARNRYPDRAHMPVDVWLFDMGAANEFIPVVAKMATSGAALDPNEALRGEIARLSAEADARSPRVAWSALTTLTSYAIGGLSEDLGWEHAAAVADYCDGALAQGLVEGTPVELARARNNMSNFWLRLGKKRGDEALLRKALGQLRAGLSAAAGGNQSDLVRLKYNLAETLIEICALRGEGEGLVEARREIRSLPSLAGRIGDVKERRYWQAAAKKSMQDIRQLDKRLR